MIRRLKEKARSWLRFQVHEALSDSAEEISNSAAQISNTAKEVSNLVATTQALNRNVLGIVTQLAALEDQLRVLRTRLKSYQEKHVETAAGLHEVEGATVLVVGAAAGEECRLFVERGAAVVHGIDVAGEIGKDYRHERVFYHEVPIERSGLPTNYFDLVYCVATMEHVHDIETGFAEMQRLARPGGMIYSVATPLWQSRFGHHMTCFESLPWIHLLYERDDLIRHARAHGVEGERDLKLEEVVDYILHSKAFNRRPGTDYLDACAGLRDLTSVRNELSLDADSLVEDPMGQQALARGFLKQNLLAVTHALIARKAAPRSTVASQ